jgi:CheY-like chemotaxis protein
MVHLIHRVTVCRCTFVNRPSFVCKYNECDVNSNTEVSLRLDDGSCVPLTNIEMSSPAIVTAPVTASVATPQATIRTPTRWRVVPMNDINETDTKVSDIITTDVPSAHSPSTTPIKSLPSSFFLPIRVLLVEDNVINQKLGMRILTKPGILPDLAVDGIHALEKCGFTAVNNQSSPLTPAAAAAPLSEANRSSSSNLVLNHNLGSPLPSSSVSSLPYSSLACTSPSSHTSISCSYDIILMDIEMPRMNGITATQELRARGVNIPIVAVTANAMMDQRTACLIAGCSDFLAKP